MTVKETEMTDEEFEKEHYRQGPAGGMRDMESKYEQLVWYARSYPEDDPRWKDVQPDIKKGALKSKERVRAEFPKDTEALATDGGDWQHGFNSGVLAALRYVGSLQSCGRVVADDMFPELDT